MKKIIKSSNICTKLVITDHGDNMTSFASNMFSYLITKNMIQTVERENEWIRWYGWYGTYMLKMFCDCATMKRGPRGPVILQM